MLYLCVGIVQALGAALTPVHRHVGIGFTGASIALDLRDKGLDIFF
jgi:hypothetical protein